MNMRALLVILAASFMFAGASPAVAGTRITVSGSEFGPMVWGPKRQAVYVFQRDSFKRSRCDGDCAKAWPPVYTSGRPVAGRGARKKLLGTIRRRNGRLQVTYRGRPLYYYAHEGPGEVRCHNVDLNGGLWWVIGADGRKRP
jgi:predicted lipoprotein with Yx(FWY)xxD motif